MKLRYLLFPLLLFARQPGFDKPCAVILLALGGSVFIWGALAAGALKVLV